MKTKKNHYEMGQQQENQGNLKEAANHYQKALEESSGSLDIYDRLYDGRVDRKERVKI